jgi:solute carrier family 8 (sodium/calcium exchanger)
MEKEGFIRSISYLQGEGLSVDTIVTDRHVQIRKWIRENLPQTSHRFDIWHIAKG